MGAHMGMGKGHLPSPGGEHLPLECWKIERQLPLTQWTAAWTVAIKLLTVKSGCFFSNSSPTLPWKVSTVIVHAPQA